jgi:hypothetical protein
MRTDRMTGAQQNQAWRRAPDQNTARAPMTPKTAAMTVKMGDRLATMRWSPTAGEYTTVR